MRLIGAGIIAITLLGAAAVPAIAQPKQAHAATTVRVFAEPG